MQTTDAVRYLAEHPGVTPSEAAEALGISVRTLRSHVKQANDDLAGVVSIDLVRNRGYSVEIQDRGALDAYLTGAEEQQRDGIPQTREERVAYLLNDLLSRSTWITLDELSEMLFASRSVLTGDLKQVEHTLEAYGLSLARRPHYGVRVEGSELARRLCLAASMMHGEFKEAVAKRDACDEDDAALSEFPDQRHLLQVIADTVDSAITGHDFHINAVAYQNLLVHIAVALARIRSGHYMPAETEHVEKIKASREWPVAQDIASKIGAAAGVELPQEEVAYLAIHLAGKQTLWPHSDGEDNLIISDEVWDVVGEMLDRIWQVFHIDFRADLELRMNLARHIVPLAVRLQYHLQVDNPILADIKTRYLLAWSLAVEADEVLRAHYGATPSEEETGYVALAFALALERQKTAPVKKSILVVCATGAGSARLLEYRCRREFGEYVDKIVTCDVMHLDQMDLTGIDYVFTTVPLGRALPVPVREVAYFFDDAEIAGMRELLRHGVPAGLLARTFDERLFFPHLPCFTKDSVLHELCEQIRRVRMVDARLEELVRERERVTATSFGNNVAMPHPLEPVSDETFIAVALLDKPVVWDERGTTVQAVFLISFARNAGRELDRLFSILAEFFMDEAAVTRLVKDQSWDCLVQLANGFEADVPPAASSST